jgi:6-phospho-beta-glucosidase
MEAGVNREHILTVLGGGSVWTPHLLKKLSELSLDTGLRIRLQGPTESHLHHNAAFFRSLSQRRLKIEVTANLKEALSGATIILNQVRIGGWAARLDDEVLPLGLGAVGDESLGLGGVRAAKRSLPFVVKLSRAIRREAPDAWLLNLMNPCDLLGRAFRRAGLKRVLGLCDHPQILAQEMATLAGKSEDASRFGFIGMTHVGWLQPPPEMDLRLLLTKCPELETWLQKWGLLPTAWRIHLSKPEMLVREQQSAPGRRVRQLIGLGQKLRQSIHRQDVVKYNLLLGRRTPSWYSEVVIPAILGIVGKGPVRLVAGLPNNGRLPGLDRQVQIETWTGLQTDDVHPEPLPQAPRCLEDVTEIGRTRVLAFNAICSDDSNALSHYVNADPFARPVLDHHDWQARLGFKTLPKAKFDKMTVI